MILVLSAEQPLPQSRPRGGEIRFRQAPSLEAVLDWIHQEPFDRVVVEHPVAALNPFALARALHRRGGPPLVLAGTLRPDTVFWAERNGCSVAANLEAALELP